MSEARAHRDRAGGVVERAEHARHVAQRGIPAGALAHRTHRLALEVDEHPAALGHLQHLTEVQVAVDALQIGPDRLTTAFDHGVERVSVRREPRHGRDRRSEPCTHAPGGGRDVILGHRACGQQRGQRAVDAGGRDPQSPRLGRELPPLAHGGEGHLPALDGAREELLRHREVPPRAPVGAAAVGPVRHDVADGTRHGVRSGIREHGRELDVGVGPIVQRAEDLGDHRVARARCRLEDDRGVRLLGREHARDELVGHPARVRGRAHGEHGHPVAAAFAGGAQHAHETRGVGGVGGGIDDRPAVPVAEHGGVRGAAQVTVATVAQRHLIERGRPRGAVEQQVDDDGDSRLRGVERDPPEFLERRGGSLVRVPPLPRHPGGDAVEGERARLLRRGDHCSA